MGINEILTRIAIAILSRMIFELVKKYIKK